MFHGEVRIHGPHAKAANHTYIISYNIVSLPPFSGGCVAKINGFAVLLFFLLLLSSSSMFPFVGNEPIYHLQMEFSSFYFRAAISRQAYFCISKVNSRFNDTAACNVSQIVSVCSLIFFL